MDALLQDLRYGLRALRRRPLFAAVAALSLAVGIGANTAIFSVVNALLLRPVAGVEAPERVVELGRTTRGSGFDTFTWPDYVDVRDEVPGLDAAAAYRFATFAVSRDGEGQRVNGLFVTPSWFRVLGLEPSLGRFFGADEARGVDRHPVAVVDHAFWRDRLGGDPGAVGSTLRLNRVAYTVVGVLPPGFRGHTAGYRPQVLVPMVQFPGLNEGQDDFDDRTASWHMALGLRAPGTSPETLDAQLATVAERLAAAHPRSNEGRGFRALPLGLVPAAARGPVRGFLSVLAGLVAVVLLVTCANVGGMFLARAAAREREIAVRLALGSGRGRLVRQLVTEGLLVFALGGALGAGLAGWAMAALPLGALPLPVDLELDLGPDLRVLLFSVAVTLATGLAFGLAPALQATRHELVGALKDDGAGGRGGGARLRRVFVAGQVGLSLVLLVAAGLFLRSLQGAAALETGFDPRDAYMTGLDLSLEGYDDADEARALQARVLERVRALPGVTAAALAIDLPLDMARHGTGVTLPGAAGDDGRGRMGVDFDVVSPGYFETLHVPLLRGRPLGAGDARGGEDVAVVSETFARRAWPGEEPLGRVFHLRQEDGERPVTVVGVAADVKNSLITDVPEPFVYLPLAQHPRSATQVLVRAPGGLEAVAPALRSAILEVDPGLSLSPVVALERYTALGLLPQRVAAGLTTGLGAVALLLSALGVYGVLAITVARRTREIGIRMALGAGRGRVLAGVVRGSLALALPGLAVGAALAALLARVLQGQGLLLGLSAADPVALGGVALLLAAVVALATLVPARRASRVEPVEALRHE